MRVYYFFITLFVVVACEDLGRSKKSDLTTQASKLHSQLIKTTPVKSQEDPTIGWAYAMLATIESEHLMMGDSVNLSPVYPIRMLIEEQAKRYYCSKGTTPLTLQGTPATLIGLLGRYGAHPYDYYQGKEKTNLKVLMRKVKKTADTAISRRAGLEEFCSQLGSLLDEELGFMPRYVHMLGAEYTSMEFGHSVCLPKEYRALTSFTHHPYGEAFSLELAGNLYGDMFMNVPINTLVESISSSLGKGHPVCWEGDISEPGFLWDDGIADIEIPHDKQGDIAGWRQRLFENFQTTDDHSMEMIGKTTKGGKRFFVCKNSWGEDNILEGLMLLSEDYVRLKTIAVYVRGE